MNKQKNYLKSKQPQLSKNDIIASSRLYLNIKQPIHILNKNVANEGMTIN